ncbi:MAG: cytochrome C oxidase subunit IV family protein [Elusimicrobia bacterium]|nr:cytochrome C oxidase subunit IV family protein [Elusimicrobiota bacterium]
MKDIKESHSMVGIYLVVFGCLTLLTGLTVGIAYLHLERTAAVMAAVFIAGLKATLITLFFMHFKFEKKIIQVTLYTALLLILVLLFILLPDLGTHRLGL